MVIKYVLNEIFLTISEMLNVDTFPFISLVHKCDGEIKTDKF